MAADRTYTEAELQRRLGAARDMARAMAWRDIFELFTDRNRQHFANLMAHGYMVVAVELQHPDGRHSRTALDPAGEWIARWIEFKKQGAAGVAPCDEPLRWEATTPGYVRFVTDSRYRKFSPAVQKWYRPICDKCGPAGMPVVQPTFEQLVEIAGRHDTEKLKGLVAFAREALATYGVDVPRAPLSEARIGQLFADHDECKTYRDGINFARAIEREHGVGMGACATEQECEWQPWCRMHGNCRRRVEQERTAKHAAIAGVVAVGHQVNPPADADGGAKGR